MLFSQCVFFEFQTDKDIKQKYILTRFHSVFLFFFFASEWAPKFYVCPRTPAQPKAANARKVYTAGDRYRIPRHAAPYRRQQASGREFSV